MPTYDYACRACGYEFEAFQSMKDEPLKKCPRCGKLKLQRLIGMGAGIVFKGSGFYETDYKRAASKSAEGKSETSGGEKKSDSSEAKPAAGKSESGGQKADS